jgi:hypothetical protein
MIINNINLLKYNIKKKENNKIYYNKFLTKINYNII